MWKSLGEKMRIGEPKPSSIVGAKSKLRPRSESTLIPNGATESGCPLVESDYHCNNEYE